MCMTFLVYGYPDYVCYVGVPWCAPVKVKQGHVRCQTPRGEHYKNVLGSRCKIHCERGYELHGSSEILCMASKQWSGKYTCRGQCHTDTIYRQIRWWLIATIIYIFLNIFLPFVCLKSHSIMIFDVSTNSSTNTFSRNILLILTV